MKRFSLGRLGIVAASVVLVAACGESSAPSDDVPALGQTLDQVDDAIVAGRYDDARAALEALVGTTTDAREEGELQKAEADRILRAADRLMSALPEEPAEAEPPAEEPNEVPPEEPEEELEEPPAEEQPTEEDTEAEEDAEKEAEKQEKEEQKRLEELEKEAEEQAEEQAEDDPGNGNGDSSENGPDDGEGN